MGRTVRAASWFAVALGACFGLSLADAWRSGRELGQPWYAASRQSAGIAPDPVEHAGLAVVQVYAAPTYGWRGLVAQHAWVVVKHAGEQVYTRYDVVGWGGSDVIRRSHGDPDAFWYGARPQLLADHQGAGVDALIDAIDKAIEAYPYAGTYRSYPGPNSNTFVAHIGRSVPQLGLDLPANAIGKDYRPLDDPAGRSPTGSGWQVSLLGLLGASVGPREGIEFNVLGLNFGIDFDAPALRLPFIGRVGAGGAAVSHAPPPPPPVRPPPSRPDAAPAPRGSAG